MQALSISNGLSRGDALRTGLPGSLEKARATQIDDTTRARLREAARRNFD
jgi:hypothetical protein